MDLGTKSKIGTKLHKIINLMRSFFKDQLGNLTQLGDLRILFSISGQKRLKFVSESRTLLHKTIFLDNCFKDFLAPRIIY